MSWSSPARSRRFSTRRGAIRRRASSRRRSSSRTGASSSSRARSSRPICRNPRGPWSLPEGEACAPFFSGACFLIRRDLFVRSRRLRRAHLPVLRGRRPLPAHRGREPGPDLCAARRRAPRARALERARSRDGSSSPAGIRPGRAPMSPQVRPAEPRARSCSPSMPSRRWVRVPHRLAGRSSSATAARLPAPGPSLRRPNRAVARRSRRGAVKA